MRHFFLTLVLLAFSSSAFCEEKNATFCVKSSSSPSSEDYEAEFLENATCYSIPSSFLDEKTPWECALPKVKNHRNTKDIKAFMNTEGVMGWIRDVRYSWKIKDSLYDVGIHRKMTGEELKQCQLAYERLKGDIIINREESEKSINDSSRKMLPKRTFNKPSEREDSSGSPLSR